MSSYFLPDLFVIYLFITTRCQFPQITAQGLDDSITHGVVRDHLFCYILTSNYYQQDLRAVYASRLDLGDEMDPNSVIIRALGLDHS
jgi:hypothetical protein